MVQSPLDDQITW